MLGYILARVQDLMRTAREAYGVDPVIFLVLYLGCAPFWYFSLFRTLRAVARVRLTRASPIPALRGEGARANEIMLWSAVFLTATVLPFIYVMLFGRSIPWWAYVLIAALVAQGAYGLVRKIRQQSGDRPV